MKKGKINNYKFWHSPIALLVLFLFLIFFSYKIIDLIKKNIETVNKKESIQKEIDILKQKEESLSRSISKLETEDGKEEIIRDKYQVTKTGEKMVTIIDNEVDQIKENDKIEHGFVNWFKNIFKR